MRTSRLTALFLSALASVPACSSSTSRCGASPGATVTVPIASLAAPADGGADGGDAGAAAAPPTVGEWLPEQVCEQVCSFVHCEVTKVEGTQATLDCFRDCTGRRPAGYRIDRSLASGSRGEHFARMAALEAASVDAFRILADELAAHRAPRRLVRACRRAARDEIRHARATRALARRHGGETREPVVTRHAPRPLEAIATENAVEGCLRETFGALVACWQARAASDPSVRAVMARIARDETRHAALAWSIDAWARVRLSRDARERIEAARRDALRAIAAAPSTLPAWAATAGLPSPRELRSLAAALERTLWSPREGAPYAIAA
jgi:hypothetical protein